MLKLLKAFRIDENTVKVMYLHKELKYEFVVEYNNINAETAKVENYDLQLDCLSVSESFNQKVIDAIAEGESESNPDLDLYLAIRDTFDAMDCESLDD